MPWRRLLSRGATVAALLLLATATDTKQAEGTLEPTATPTMPTTAPQSDDLLTNHGTNFSSGLDDPNDYDDPDDDVVVDASSTPWPTPLIPGAGDLNAVPNFSLSPPVNTSLSETPPFNLSMPNFSVVPPANLPDEEPAISVPTPTPTDAIDAVTPTLPNASGLLAPTPIPPDALNLMSNSSREENVITPAPTTAVLPGATPPVPFGAQDLSVANVTPTEPFGAQNLSVANVTLPVPLGFQNMSVTDVPTSAPLVFQNMSVTDATTPALATTNMTPTSAAPTPAPPEESQAPTPAPTPEETEQSFDEGSDDEPGERTGTNLSHELPTPPPDVTNVQLPTVNVNLSNWTQEANMTSAPAATVLTTTMEPGSTTEHVGCCYSVGNGPTMAPCCLRVEPATEAKCLHGERHPQVGPFGGRKGWSIHCPESAEEGHRWITERSKGKEHWIVEHAFRGIAEGLGFLGAGKNNVSEKQWTCVGSLLDSDNLTCKDYPEAKDGYEFALNRNAYPDLVMASPYSPVPACEPKACPCCQRRFAVKAAEDNLTKKLVHTFHLWRFGEKSNKAKGNVSKGGVGCCFRIGYGTFKSPCCLQVEQKNQTDCLGDEDKPQIALFGGARGWRDHCPATPEEAQQWLHESKGSAPVAAGPSAPLTTSPAVSPAVLGSTTLAPILPGMAPPTSTCTGPLAESIPQAGNPTCREGAMIVDGQSCTPSCADGYVASPADVILACHGGSLVPSSFTCIPRGIGGANNSKATGGQVQKPDMDMVELCGTLEFRMLVPNAFQSSQVEQAVRAALINALSLLGFQFEMHVSAEQSQGLAPKQCGGSPAPPAASNLRRRVLLDAALPPSSSLESWNVIYTVIVPFFQVGAVVAAARGLHESPSDLVDPLFSSLAPALPPAPAAASAASPASDVIVTDVSEVSVVSGLKSAQAENLKSDKSSGRQQRVNVILMAALSLGLTSLVCLVCAGLSPKKENQYQQVDDGQEPPPFAACMCCGKIICSM